MPEGTRRPVQGSQNVRGVRENESSRQTARSMGSQESGRGRVPSGGKAASNQGSSSHQGSRVSGGQKLNGNGPEDLGRRDSSGGRITATRQAAKKLADSCKMSKVFFTNSGTEAIEGAIKAARKYAYLKDGTTDHEIIAMKHSFHGRSMGALSVTGNDHYQEPFKPMIGGVKFAEFNNLDSVKELITEKAGSTRQSRHS